MLSRFYKKINITDNELIVEVIRKSLWSWLWSLILAVILLLLPFFLIYPLLLQGGWGLMVFIVTVILALILLYRIYLNYFYTALVVTNKRLIDMEQLGFFSQSTNVILYNKIQDVNFKTSGLLPTLLKIGDIYISFIGDHNSFIELTTVKYPSLVVSKIIRQREKYFESKRQNQGQEAIKLLNKIKKRLGEDKFNQLISN